jgi:hypothetical protein
MLETLLGGKKMQPDGQQSAEQKALRTAWSTLRFGGTAVRVSRP